MYRKKRPDVGWRQSGPRKALTVPKGRIRNRWKDLDKRLDLGWTRGGVVDADQGGVTLSKPDQDGVFTA
ncbi:hypothetical protein THS27_02840 [Thalassospira sp. MCCC 1A01428]|nr:hypothetical protein THS27_02840 [Thalassospira sp. MCCC 1A01428]